MTPPLLALVFPICCSPPRSSSRRPRGCGPRCSSWKRTWPSREGCTATTAATSGARQVWLELDPVSPSLASTYRRFRPSHPIRPPRGRCRPPNSWVYHPVAALRYHFIVPNRASLWGLQPGSLGRNPPAASGGRSCSACGYLLPQARLFLASSSGEDALCVCVCCVYVCVVGRAREWVTGRALPVKKRLSFA